MTVADVLRQFSKAWSRKQIDKVVDLFADDGVYAASIGPAPGKTARGRVEIRALVEHMFAVDQGAKVETSAPAFFDQGAFWKWKYTMPDGSVELGCDVLQVRDGKIILKDAYRKVRTEAGG